MALFVSSRQHSMLTSGEERPTLVQQLTGPSLTTLVASAIEEWLDAPELGTEDLLYLERALAHNLRTGRVYRVLQQQNLAEVPLPLSLYAELEGDGTEEQQQLSRLLGYIRLMVGVYLLERDRLAALSASEPEEWNALTEQLTRQAYHQLVARSIGPWYAHDKATELAQQACVRVFSAVYPCDISFDYWVGAILKNLVLEFLTRSRDLLDRNLRVTSIDQLDEQGIEPSAPEPSLLPATGTDANAISFAFGDNEALLQAIHGIRSDDRRAVLIMTYFQELDDEEIAERIGKSRGAVHTLRCRALTQLRSALTRMNDAHDEDDADPR